MKNDAQKAESTAGTDMTCQILLIKFLDVSAVLRACCASVHSFLVWVSIEIEFFEVVFRHHPKCFFDETHRFASSEPVSRCLSGVLKSIPAMNSIDWNQFHTPKKPLSIARVRSARTPEMGRGLPGDQLLPSTPLLPHPAVGRGARDALPSGADSTDFDGLFRPSSPDSAGKDLLLDIGGEEDEPEREEPSSPAPPPRTPHQERPCPDPYRPKAPTALTARPTTPASGAVEHKDKGTGAARPILDDDDVPSPPKPKAAPAAAKPKKDREAPKRQEGGPGGRQPGPPHEAKEAAEAKGSDDAPRRTPGRGTGTSTRPQWRSPPRRRTRAAVPPNPRRRPSASGPGRPTRTTSPRRPLAKYCRGSSISLSEKCHGKRAHVLLSSIDPCPSLARPLAYERLGAIVEWFEKLGAAVLFSIIVQTSALDEARYQVVDGSHRTADRASPKGGEAQQATPQIRQHLKEDYIDVAVYNTLDPEAMLELQHRVNLLTHDARFGSSTFDVLLNLKRASLQAPKRYIREDPDFATHLEPALKELHFPKGEDAPAKLVKILECFSLEMLCALSQLPVERQPSATNLWRIFEARDAEMNRWLARAMLEGSFSGSEATSTAAADLKKPIRQAEQTFMLLEAHDAAEVAAGDHPRPLPAPDEAAREILRCHLVRTETFAFMNCLNVRPFPFRKGKVRLPAFSEELGELGCPFERLNETDVGNMPQEITFMDGRRLSEFELVLGYWLGWCAAQLPPAMQDYLMPEHCPYARLWEEMGHHDIPVPASAC
ncbi:hypothetical protein PAPYR_7100 [Paratrimastix pyriformis]|uniref:Uncharacterized protein n=1 Tax=Paratrimastix pyriformis TaxID=342808 RepID=A0ABQ8UG60_9EUKA|nr:hypothetical protein PAPYR_7100 [Paratrimastix pyriformis]